MNCDKSLSVDAKKKQMRKEVLSKRNSLKKGYKVKADLQICEGLKTNLEFSSNSSIAVYSPVGSEVDITQFVEYIYKEHPNVNVCYPYVKDGKIKLIRITEGRQAPFIKDPLWIPDDAELEEYLHIGFHRITSVLVPLIAFDKNCNRLGHGGGCYDDLIAKVPSALKIGIGYKEQLVPKVPIDSNDNPVDLVLSNGKNKWKWYGGGSCLK